VSVPRHDAVGTPLSFAMEIVIDRPLEEVFDHLIEPNLLSSYFTSAASGPLVEGADVRWEFPGGESETVHVETIERNRRIVFTWRAFEVETVTRVTMRFEALDPGRTKFTIEESGWTLDGPGARSAFEHCAGWKHMQMCLRARLRFGVDLRG
jgi:uncharacterized protein YndB with AHSA1/START domain